MSKNIIWAILVFVIIGGLGFWIIQKNPSTLPAPVAENNTDLNDDTNIEPPTRPNKDPKNSFANFNQDVTLRVTDSVTFPDGLNLKLMKIDDSRCPKDVQCIWAGELSGNFFMSRANEAADFPLGTITAKVATIGAYTFTLKDATEISMTIYVTKK